MQERARRYAVGKRKDAPEGPFYLYWTENGRQRRRSTGLYEEGLALALRDRLNAEEAERAVFGKASVEGRVTFAYAALAYLNASETDEERAARGRFMTVPIERLGDMALRSIDEEILREESRKAYPLAKPATRRRQFYGPALAVLNWSSKRARGWCDKPDFDRPPDSKPRTQWVSPETADKICATVHDDPRALVPFELGFGAGLRASEAARLDWADVYLQSAQALIGGGKSDAATRLVALPPRTVAALARLPWKEGPVCRTPKGEPYVVRKGTGGLFNDMLATACKTAKTERVTFHVLRHSWATWRASADRDLIRLMTLGGWRSLDMVQRYAKLAPANTGAEAASYGWDFTATRPPVENEERKTA